MDRGLIHIYCGDGKGKTTASIGLAVRAAGRDLKVVFAQFLKSAPTGELKILAAIPQVTHLRGDENCTFSFGMDAEQRSKCYASHAAVLNQSIALCEKGLVDVLVLDEIIGAYNSGLVDKERLLYFIKNKPESVEVVLTGRNPCRELIALGDYVSEIKNVKHPYDAGIPARTGIER
ncbi:cob(I)yrinic acid a,c-diamide adenosyltransferase [Anaerotalea alkaliphila]|uniref:Cob(I)yrinic acid a,c-diamide adenosyltransferase n=1 Tax=Anaerotalea alkaliphila TaxID=2662126 RepID=A0A7X5HXD0_9FIRM|nr:cob(I)yrinic acid a,c-diamide adenosyltransferase [Anaerotalea alkaliphila]NDL68346.1 cob(I)yrinic acid a,c-diamide adenosyltransferase [Anaerotalea alkaliphila]